MSADDSVTKFAQKNRLLAAAALLQVTGDESAPPNARVAAAEKILAYSDGRPGTSRRITLTDVAALTADQREQLAEALIGVMSHDERQHLLHLQLRYYELEFPGEFKVKMLEAFEEVMAKQAKPAKRGRFERDALPLLPPPLNSPASCVDSAWTARKHVAAIESHAKHSGTQTPVEPEAGEVSNEPSEQQPGTQTVNGRIPVNPLLPHLDNPAPKANGHLLFTEEMVRRTALPNPYQDPFYWRR